MALQYLIDNEDIFKANSIVVVKAEGLFNGAKQRLSKRTWADKSGVDIDFTNARLDTQEYTLECLCEANTKQDLAQYMYVFNRVFLTKVTMVLSVRGDFRNAFLVSKEKELKGKYYRSAGNKYAYLFKLVLTDVNPAAQRWITQLAKTEKTVAYTGEKAAYIYWGDGSREILPGSGNYNHNYSAESAIDIIIDYDGETIFEAGQIVYDTTGVCFTANNGFNLKFIIDFTYSGMGSNLFEPNYPSERKIEVIRDDVVVYSNSNLNLNIDIPYSVNQATDFEIRLWGLYTLNGEPVWYAYPILLQPFQLEIISGGLTHYKNGYFPYTPEYTVHLDLSNNDLSQDAIDNLLNENSIASSSNGYLNISGGTNATPSTEGIAVIDVLISKGWEVHYNV